MSARSILDAAISEADLQRTVEEMARSLGYLVFHFPDKALAEIAKSKRWDAMPDKGFPDTWICGHGRLIVAELKDERGQLTSDQRRWLAALREVEGIEVHVWRPRDLDEIEQTLLRVRTEGEM